MKTASILEEGHGIFGLEYDNTRGEKNAMRLDAVTYETAVREARSFLGINDDHCDKNGEQWDVE